MQAPRKLRRLWATGASVAAAAVVLAACGSSGGGTTTTGGQARLTGGTVVMGSQLTGSLVNYGPFPMTSFSVCSTTNFEFIQLSTLPLYWFGNGQTGAPTVNLGWSVAASLPTFSNGDQTITIHLKNMKWSDGTPVTSRDLVFW